MKDELHNDIALRVSDLSKAYDINATRHTKLSEELGNFGRQLFNKNKPQTKSLFYALKNVSFEVKRGEVIGLIGKNGSGKSTLLKLIGGAIAPTEGTIEHSGAITSIFDIGTGFHQDLSGIENIYLRGSLLGMDRKTISSQLDEIILFSEIGEFAHQPVKHYSSGMYLRLAFSIIAFLQPDILLLDEILFVGDAEFQLKCKKKIRDLALRNDSTVLLASHSIQELISIADKLLFIEEGQMKAFGEPYSTADLYMNETLQGYAEQLQEEHLVNSESSGEDDDLDQGEENTQTGYQEELHSVSINEIKALETERHFSHNDPGQQESLQLNSISLLANDGSPNVLSFDKQIHLVLNATVLKENSEIEFVLQLGEATGAPIIIQSASMYQFDGKSIFCRDKGDITLECVFPPFFFTSGFLMLGIGHSTPTGFIKTWPQALIFKIEDPNIEQKSQSWFKNSPSRLGPSFTWLVTQNNTTEIYQRKLKLHSISNRQ